MQVQQLNEVNKDVCKQYTQLHDYSFTETIK